ncbi:MAG: hypothetical protein KAS32_00300 [Candidatus Peribacteraceae bacterium]|nr:hypothetical protein [Candidatus Peribacteraceae bacterium]
MSKETTVKVKIAGNQLNRAMIYNIVLGDKPLIYTVLHNKQTSPLQFVVEQTPHIKNGELLVSMHRNLTNAKFCQTFFNLENLKEEKYDYQSKFKGIKREFEKDVYQFSKEKLDLSISNASNRPSNNYMLLLGWKVYGFEDDLAFIFVQRRCYNAITRTNIIRTAGLQFSTPRGLEYLDKYLESYNQTQSEKEASIDFLDFDEDEVVED